MLNPDFSGPSIGRGGGTGGSNYHRPQRDFHQEQFSKDSYNSNFTTAEGIGPQGIKGTLFEFIC